MFTQSLTSNHDTYDGLHNNIVAMETMSHKEMVINNFTMHSFPVKCFDAPLDLILLHI